VAMMRTATSARLATSSASVNGRPGAPGHRSPAAGHGRAGCQAARRRTSQTATAMSSADSTSSQPASIHWNVQNRLVGW
jgi:hypothetical protein